MLKNNKIDEQEIDLLEILLILWKSKIKILIVTIILFILFGINIFIKHKDTPVYLINANIKSISSADEFGYSKLNLFINYENEMMWQNKAENENYYKNINSSIDKLLMSSFSIQKFLGNIDKEYLLDLFVEKFLEGRTLKNNIKKFELVKKESFANEDLYKEEINRLASNFKITKNLNFDKDAILNWQIQIESTQNSDWKEFFKSVELELNEETRLYINQIVKEIILQKKFENLYNIENINREIELAFVSYEKKMSNRIAFLKEQAEIARTLGMEKNNQIKSSETQINKIKINENFITETPYYMRGYEVIEKEIDLIINRKDKKVFIEKIRELEDLKNRINSDETIERFEALLLDTPIYNPKKFSAGKISLIELKNNSVTDYKNLSTQIMVIIFSGLILGSIIVLIENSLRLRNFKRR
jgi:LPS O-antigen subunit length determinant protein (WzzB/FepE family)